VIRSTSSCFRIAAAFDPCEASKPILVVAIGIGTWSALVTAQQADSLPARETKVERLQARIESVESIRANKRVQYDCGHYVELGLWNDFADLFAEDAVTNYQSGVRGKTVSVSSSLIKQAGQGKSALSRVAELASQSLWG
jgi:hypothetical protein